MSHDLSLAQSHAFHLARTLMGENPGFTSALPLVGPALVEELRELAGPGNVAVTEEKSR